MTTRFQLNRVEDATGVSGTGIVAHGVRFPNGKCALAWATAHTSIAVYDDAAALAAIHCHGGKTRVEWLDAPPAKFDHGRRNCLLNGMENAPFASIGGLACRALPVRPGYISEAEWPDFRQGYEFAAAEAYGSDWRTCEFGWAAVLTIEAAPARVTG